MNDHLDRETSVSVELTETGVRAMSQSRFVAAIDRLGGNLAELVNAPMERRIARERTIAASEAELIAAVTKFGIEKLRSDPAFAERVAERHFTRVFEKQLNKDAVLLEALEDLRHDKGGEAHTERPLDAEFLDRLEYYAEGATSEQVRQKWGRVLSAEIKKPGSFSAKAMRIVDELDAETARLFEGFCKQAFKGVAPKCLAGILPFYVLKQFVSAGLIVDPGGIGHVAMFAEVRSEDGKALWVYDFGNGRSVSVPMATQLAIMAGPDFAGPVQLHKAVAAVPVYLLTEVGEAISSIFPPNDAPERYVKRLREALPDVEVVEFEQQSDGRFHAVAGPANEPTQQPAAEK
jgi:hypothetical protein